MDRSDAAQRKVAATPAGSVGLCEHLLTPGTLRDPGLIAATPPGSNKKTPSTEWFRDFFIRLMYYEFSNRFSCKSASLVARRFSQKTRRPRSKINLC
jgi:hypothetical protein